MINHLRSVFVIMNNSLNFQDFKSNEHFTFEVNQETTILDLKTKLAQEEGFDNPKSIQFFWQCIKLEDHFLAQDLLDKNSDELYVDFPQYASINCEGNAETFVFWKTEGKKKWMKMYPGSTETLKIPSNGKFAVMRNRVSEEQELYNARLYHVQNDWEITIRVDNDTFSTKVYLIQKEGEEIELIPKDVKQYSTKENKSKLSIFLKGASQTLSLASFVVSIVELCV